MMGSSPERSRRAVLRAIATGAALAASAALPLGCGSGRHPAEQHPVWSPRSEDAAAGAPVLMIIRHGEKPAGSDAGIDSNGHRAKSSMTAAGHLRARRLTDVFAPAQGAPRPGLARPRLLYAAGANSDGEGKRTRETVDPLARRLGVPVDTTFGKGEEKALVEQVISQPGPALICWQHSEIPDIVAELGQVSPTPPQDWPDDRFDLIWVLRATAGGWDFAQIPELVLPGDRSTVIEN